MKKNILLLLLIAGLGQVFGQITIDRGHVVVSGQKIIEGTDTNLHPLAVSGANKTWDFKALKAHSKDSIRFGREFWYPGSSFFPKANMAYVDYGDDSTFNFLSVNDANITFYGGYQDPDPFEFEFTVITFPSTYNTSFTSPTMTFFPTTLPLGFDPDSSGPMPFIDSLRFTPTRNSKSVMDGWGTMKTPLGDFPSLKQTITNISSASLDMYTGGNWINVPPAVIALLQIDVPTADTGYDVSFWTNNARVGYPLVSYSYAPGEDSATDITWNMATAQSSGLKSVNTDRNRFSYPNPVKQELTVLCPVNEATVKIYDMNGQLVLEQSINQQTVISLQQFSNGIYLLQLTDKSNGLMMASEKIIKQ